MAKMSSNKRAALPDSSFVFPEQRGFPIPDEAHATAALRMAGRADPSHFGMENMEMMKKKIYSKVCAKYPQLAVCKKCGECKK